MTPFKHKIVRDLAWVIDSPELCFFKPELHLPLRPEKPAMDWLWELDQDPSELIDFVSIFKIRERLGKYYEILLHFYLEEQGGFQQVIRGVQVQADNHTYGEFDFLLKDSNECWIHLEVAVKFYLAVPIQGTTQFVGPNAKDSWQRKRKKLLEKQIELGKLPQAGNTLKELNIRIDQQKIRIQGYVFINPEEKRQLDLSELNPLAKKGWWYYLDQFPTDAQSPKEYAILNKLNWLAPVFDEAYELYEAHEIVAGVKQGKLKLPLCLAEIQEESGIQQEVSRGFIVRESWPDATT